MRDGWRIQAEVSRYIEMWEFNVWKGASYHLISREWYQKASYAIYDVLYRADHCVLDGVELIAHHIVRVDQLFLKFRRAACSRYS